MKIQKVEAVPVKLNPSIFKERMEINRKYMLALDESRLLANYYVEAGLNSNIHFDSLPKHYGGWEEPDFQVKGSFTGHYMSAAAFLYHFEGDKRIRAKGDYMVEQLAYCQSENENNWAGSIPPVYLDRIARNKWVWAPQYVVHKTFMGLVDMYKYADNKLALEVADKWADWFLNWSNQFDEEKMAAIADWESGGQMEVWADLFEITKNEKYKTLMERYLRRNLFYPLLEGKDVLTNKHANTSIPEAHGCARAYEVTGDERYRKMVENFWRFTVEERPQFSTGGHTAFETWINDQRGKLTNSNQEFCTVYNMIRLADYLFRWTNDPKYGDYIEKNYYNGVLAQQNKSNGQVTYFLPMEAGSRKAWDDAFSNFYCCYGTMVQAQTSYGGKILYKDKKGLSLSQYIPFNTTMDINGIKTIISLEKQCDVTEKGDYFNKYSLSIKADRKNEFDIRLRLPQWCKDYSILVNGVAVLNSIADGWFKLSGAWEDDTVAIIFAPHVYTVPLGENDCRHAFMYGPIALVGLVDKEYEVKGNAKDISDIVKPDNVIMGDFWRTPLYIKGQTQNFKLMPFYDVVGEQYTVYFPFRVG